MAHREDPWWASDPDEKPVPLVPGTGPPTPHSGEAARYEDSEERDRQMSPPLIADDDDATGRPAPLHRPTFTARRWLARRTLTARAVGGAATVVLVIGCVQMFGAGWRHGSAVAEKLSSTSSPAGVGDSSRGAVTTVTPMVHMEESRSRRPLLNDLKRARKREVRRQR